MVLSLLRSHVPHSYTSASPLFPSSVEKGSPWFFFPSLKMLSTPHAQSMQFVIKQNHRDIALHARKAEVNKGSSQPYSFIYTTNESRTHLSIASLKNNWWSSHLTQSLTTQSHSSEADSVGGGVAAEGRWGISSAHDHHPSLVAYRDDRPPDDAKK